MIGNAALNPYGLEYDPLQDKRVQGAAVCSSESGIRLRVSCLLCDGGGCRGNVCDRELCSLVNVRSLGACEGATLYRDKTCLTCHGTDAKTPVSPDFPKLAGQTAVYLERQMLDIKSGARSNGNSLAMKGVMAIVSEAEIKQLADYISKLK